MRASGLTTTSSGKTRGRPVHQETAGLPAIMDLVYGHAGPTAKLDHVAERFATLWTDLEQEKQVGPLRRLPA